MASNKLNRLAVTNPDPNDSDDSKEHMGSDSVFTVVAPNAGQNSSESRPDTTFTKYEPTINRSASAVRSEALALTRKLSVRSDQGSLDIGLTPTIDAFIKLDSSVGSIDSIDEETTRSHDRSPSRNSLSDLLGDCSLTHAASIKSTKSAKSVKSVHSIHATGGLPLGCLRIHTVATPPASPNTNAKGKHHEVLKSGDVVVIRDVPLGSLLGYDTRSITITKAGVFEGIRDLPAGLHFIWGGTAKHINRTGFWIMSPNKESDEPGEIHVKRYDQYNETLGVEHSVAETRIQKISITEIAHALHPYSPYPPGMEEEAEATSSNSIFKDKSLWYRVSWAITGDILCNITGDKWNQWEVCTDTEIRPVPKDILISEPEDMTLKNDNEFFTFLFPTHYRDHLKEHQGRFRTEAAMDNTVYIHHIIDNYSPTHSYDDILGEMQFCYATGMSLTNMACVDHWTHIVKTIFGAFRIIVENPTFMRKFIGTVHAQFIWNNWFSDSIMSFNEDLVKELKIILTTFKARMNEYLLGLGTRITDEQEAVGKSFEDLESWLWKWGWDLRGNYVRSGFHQTEEGDTFAVELTDFEAEDERGEYAPVIMDLDDKGRDRGSIRL